MIDISTENLITISEAARRLPGRVAFSTIWRWALQGVRCVRLETTVIGGRRYTSIEAMQRFSERCLAAANGEPAPTRTAKQREREIAAAEAVLDEAGI